MSLAEKWEEYRAKFEIEYSDSEIRELERAFYAGAEAVSNELPKQMSAIKTPNRYQVTPTEKLPYKFAVEEKRDIAYASEESIALGYAAQMNERGFIEI